MRALHATGERVPIAQLGDWEVRRHDEHGPHHHYFTTRGMLHLQLWHPRAQISILTPSILTGGRFDIWRDGIRIAVSTWADVAYHLIDEPLPSAAEIAALRAWTVTRDELAARRARPADATA